MGLLTGNITIRPAKAEEEERNHEHIKTDHLLPDLKRRTISGGVVTMSAQAAKFALNLVSTVILARLLIPRDFGLVAMVTAVTGFLAMFRHAGLATPTVQREHLTHAQVSNLFWINLGVSGLCTLGRARSGKHLRLVDELLATFASLGGYVCCYLVDARYGRRVAAADSITRLRAYWSPCRDWLHLHVSAATKDSSTRDRDCTGVE